MKSNRLESLDALRGFDMIFISGLQHLVVSLCTLCGLRGCWLASQMSHSTWDGLRQHDTIFPLFLFLAGVSWPFSLASQRDKGRSEGAIVLRLAKRALTLVLFALVLGGLLTFNWPRVRYLGVLSTIGVCGGVAAAIYMFVPSVVKRLWIAVGILVGYYLLIRFVPAPDAASLPVPSVPEWQGTGPFSLLGNLCGYIDRCLLPGRFYTYVGPDGVGLFEEDGILHNISAVVSAMLGIFAGEIVRMPEIRLSGGRKALMLLGCGGVCLVATLAWMPFCPVNMKWWSPTYVLANGAYSFVLFALFYWLIDVKGCGRWAFLLRVIGMNSIAIYLLNTTGLMTAVGRYFTRGLAELVEMPGYAGMVHALGLLTVNCLAMYWFYHKDTFLRV